MKSFLFSIAFLAFATAMSAQSNTCCIPCPPGCCIISCSPASAAAVSLDGKNDNAPVSPVSCTVTACCMPQKMSKKEMKACMKACESGNAVQTGQCEIKCAPGAAAQAEQKTDVIFHGVPKAHKG